MTDPRYEKPDEEEEAGVVRPTTIPTSYYDDLRRYLLGQRTVIIDGEMDTYAHDITRELIYLSLKKEPIYVILNSVGGEVYSGLQIHETIRRTVEQGVSVTIETRGLAASMGAIVLQAASEGGRVATRYSRFLIHEIWSASSGSVREQEDQVEELRHLNDMLREILSKKTGKSPKQIENVWKRKDVWFSADEAKEFGLVDLVV